MSVYPLSSASSVCLSDCVVQLGSTFVWSSQMTATESRSWRLRCHICLLTGSFFALTDTSYAFAGSFYVFTGSSYALIGSSHALIGSSFALIDSSYAFAGNSLVDW